MRLAVAAVFAMLTQFLILSRALPTTIAAKPGI